MKRPMGVMRGSFSPVEKSRHAVFFGIHAHTAEFVDREYLPVFGEAVLLVEGGAAVSFDKETDDEHGDGEDDEGCEGEDDVDDALPEEVLGDGEYRQTRRIGR